MPHHERHHVHHEHGPTHPPPPGGMGECPCTQCRKPMSKEEEISLLEEYKKGVRERLDHVERRLEELHKV